LLVIPVPPHHNALCDRYLPTFSGHDLRLFLIRFLPPTLLIITFFLTTNPHPADRELANQDDVSVTVFCGFNFVQALESTLPFDQAAILEENTAYIRDSLGLEEVRILDADGAEGDLRKKSAAEPGRPTLYLF